MTLLMDRSIIRINLKTAKKNDRMDVCSRYLKMVRNSAIIIDKLFEMIYYFPESFSNHEVQSCMQRNSHRTFPSLHKCICSLNQQNQNVVLVNTKCAYAMEETDCLVKILLDLSNQYKNVIDLEYDAVKNCLQDKNTLENVQEGVSLKHNDNFESMVGGVNTICQNQEKNNTVQKRRKVVKPQSENKYELDKNKYFPFLNIPNNSVMLCNPIYKVRAIDPTMLMALVNSKMDPYSFCEANASLGEIVYDGEGPASAVPEPQPSHQRNTRNVALPNATVSNDNPTQGRLLDELSNSESVPSSIPNAHERHGNQQNFIPNEEATGGTSVPAFTAVDQIRYPWYQTYSARLSTFTKWPSDLTQKPEHVAQAGFFYTGLQDVVRCFACDGGLKNWDPEDDPWIDHARWFPLCPFVQKVKGQEFVELVRRMTEESDEEEDAVVHSTFQRNSPMAHPPDLQQLNLTNDTDDGIRCPQYRAYRMRLSTFTKCPLNMSQRSERFARAGFYYTGDQDAVKCFACGGRIQIWDPEVDPWFIHSRNFPHCPFVLRLTVEPDEDDAVVHSTFQRNNPMAHPPDLQQQNLTNDTDIQTIQRENEFLKSIVTCMKCKVQSRNILFLPCTHHCLCQDCAERCSLCPVCYKIINEKIKTFMI